MDRSKAVDQTLSPSVRVWLRETKPKKGPPGPWEEAERLSNLFCSMKVIINGQVTKDRNTGNFVHILSKSQQLRTGKLPALLQCVCVLMSSI